MADTYTQLYVHLVFAVKGRFNLISPRWKDEMYKYICGIITNKKQKPLAINGLPDHIHLLIGFNPDCTLSDLVRDLKSNTSKWINERKFVTGKFEWQIGYGAFSIGQSQLDKIIKYISNQENHHKTKPFREEYIEFLKKYQINYKPEYIFDDIDVVPAELQIK